MAKTLAWHETLEIHELVASQANLIMELKRSINNIKDAELKSLFAQAIDALEKNVKELLQFFPSAPETRAEDSTVNDKLNVGQLLMGAKSNVRNYAAAITETATPQLRKVLKKHLNGNVDLHEKVFNYMYKKGLYPAYDLETLLKNDQANAQKALNMKY
ncbi:MAG: spore coat protein [Bacillus sp. (in: firmicutes)]